MRRFNTGLSLGRFPSERTAAPERRPEERLLELLQCNSDAARFMRLPFACQASVGDLVIARTKQCDDMGIARTGEAFLQEHGLPYHRRFLDERTPPRSFRDWRSMETYAQNARRWQQRIYRASISLRRSDFVALGTDQLAVSLCRQLSLEVPGAKLHGVLRTSEGGSRGRPRGIEACLSYGLHRPGLLGLDGKNQLTIAELTKAAEDSRAARRYNSDYQWVQVVLLLPCGCDVRSDRVLAEALNRRVIIATTALPVRPLGLES